MITEKEAAVTAWRVLLDDLPALMENPGGQHKFLLTAAYALHRAQVIDGEDLSDMLELADGALAFAFEESLGCG
ncbi:hypothetical protein [Pseudomonas syringae]|uniref:hypothetical protein n=1 Tax=Pseudomonas syringae TaxID=317 RepID=UPI0002A79AE3|nr:hypothetical protein [Pseudomonas syringae]ELQ00584.1 hypothetical protein A979_12035 [Pseudomonas syringae BRIP34876]ELQ06846.1 hypothetical protein A987_01136 [Pseudomonas syringae BRIP34881]